MKDIKFAVMNKKDFDKKIDLLDRTGTDLEELTLRCTIWHDLEKVTLMTELINGSYDVLLDGIADDDEELEDNEDNTKELKKLQKKLSTKLKKWADNWGIRTEISEQNV